ncbi:MAG: hypothetical protein JKY46_02900 [Robiginitomaculum sp.]|nr:hypothetical protein [Robiginitomaculum sp.]
MTTSMIVIDDFLDDALNFRNAVLNLDFPKADKPKGYPGKNSQQKIQLPGLEQEISRIVQEPLTAKRDAGHGTSRITLAGETGAANIHIDQGHWSGILYLTLPEHCQGGTQFFRHKESGTERALLEKSDLAALGTKNPAEANRIYNNILDNDTHDMSKWEMTMQVPMRFNRLVLIRPWLWHTAGAGFGTSMQDGRLVYLLFFDQQKTT